MKAQFAAAVAAMSLLLNAAPVLAADIGQWSAAIGTGHAGSSGSTSASQGAPGSPHWTAMIGTGRAVATVGAGKKALVKASGVQMPGASPHWTSKIGTGRAADSSQHAQSTGARVTLRQAQR